MRMAGRPQALEAHIGGEEPDPARSKVEIVHSFVLAGEALGQICPKLPVTPAIKHAETLGRACSELEKLRHMDFKVVGCPRWRRC